MSHSTVRDFPAISLNSAPESWERIKVAGGGFNIRFTASFGQLEKLTPENDPEIPCSHEVNLTLLRHSMEVHHQ